MWKHGIGAPLWAVMVVRAQHIGYIGFDIAPLNQGYGTNHAKSISVVGNGKSENADSSAKQTYKPHTAFGFEHGYGYGFDAHGKDKHGRGFGVFEPDFVSDVRKLPRPELPAFQEKNDFFAKFPSRPIYGQPNYDVGEKNESFRYGAGSYSREFDHDYYSQDVRHITRGHTKEICGHYGGAVPSQGNVYGNYGGLGYGTAASLGHGNDVSHGYGKVRNRNYEDVSHFYARGGNRGYGNATSQVYRKKIGYYDGLGHSYAARINANGNREYGRNGGRGNHGYRRDNDLYHHHVSGYGTTASQRFGRR